jgi:hypothetical protein
MRYVLKSGYLGQFFTSVGSGTMRSHDQNPDIAAAYNSGTWIETAAECSSLDADKRRNSSCERLSPGERGETTTLEPYRFWFEAAKHSPYDGKGPILWLHTHL